MKDAKIINYNMLAIAREFAGTYYNAVHDIATCNGGIDATNVWLDSLEFSARLAHERLQALKAEIKRGEYDEDEPPHAALGRISAEYDDHGNLK